MLFLRGYDLGILLEVKMQLTIEQKVNMLAIEILELYGNEKPTQAQIDMVERFILKHEDDKSALDLSPKLV